MTRHATDVYLRFKEEQNNIRAFVSVTDEFMRPNDFAVAKLNEVLHEAGFIGLPTRTVQRVGTPFADQEFQKLIDSMDQYEGPITSKIFECDKELAFLDDYTTKTSQELGGSDIQRRCSWVKHLLGLTPPARLEDLDDAGLENLFVGYMQSDREKSSEESDFLFYFRYLRDLAKAKRVGSISVRLELVRETFKRIRVAHRMRDPNADVNIMRQGFLLLMTAFDAAVFDMVRVAMRPHFFRLIARFAKKETIPIKEWGNFQTVDEFQTRMIERCLKGFYLKDLLEAIRGMGVEITKDDGDSNKLFETIQRRNLHVHNRGFVDERYLETDDKGTPKFNIFKLTPGEMAVIGDEYFGTALKLTFECVQLLQDWVMNGAAIKKG